MTKSKTAFTIGFVLGTATGAAVAVLLAPARGEETRQWVRTQGLELSGRGEETAQRMMAQSKEAAAQQGARLTSKLERLKTRLSPEDASTEAPSQEDVTSS